MDWLVDLTLRHGIGGLAIGALLVAGAVLVVLGVATFLLYLVAQFRDGFRRGWDRPS
jgi:hypothetical protein